tara:strand:+ start:940 stop:2148 length:1209 start_codon:yes stop_codon:yes gene_type:complete
MLNKKYFFSNFFPNSQIYKKNLSKTKKIFRSLKVDINNFEIPTLFCHEKDYAHDFSNELIKKFSKYQNIVVVGMGGSILGTKSIYSFFKTKVKKKIFFLDNLDENLHNQFLKIKNSKNTCFIIISKSGNTIETIANFGILYSRFKLKNKLIFITENEDNFLSNLASKLDAEIIQHPNFIGGRYSVLSEVGMFPAALMGLNFNKFKNLKKLINNNNFISTLIHNVASIYTLNFKGFKNSVILNYDSKLNDLGFWYQQLVGESLGKKGKGITPILSRGPKDHHSLLQLYLDGTKDKFFTFFSPLQKDNKQKISNKLSLGKMKFLKNKSLNFIVKAQYKAIKKVFISKQIPFREIIFNKNNEEELGAVFTFFVLETILLSRLMNVNPFDQPAVEQVKIETKNFLI